MEKMEANLLDYIIKIMHDIAVFAPSSFAIFRYEMTFAHLLAMQLSAATYISSLHRDNISRQALKKKERKKRNMVKITVNHSVNKCLLNRITRTVYFVNQNVFPFINTNGNDKKMLCVVIST